MEVFVVSVQMGNLITTHTVTAVSESIARTIVHMRYPMCRVIGVKPVRESYGSNVVLVDFRAKRRLTR